MIVLNNCLSMGSIFLFTERQDKRLKLLTSVTILTLYTTKIDTASSRTRKRWEVIPYRLHRQVY